MKEKDRRIQKGSESRIITDDMYDYWQNLTATTLFLFTGINYAKQVIIVSLPIFFFHSEFFYKPMKLSDNGPSS